MKAVFKKVYKNKYTHIHIHIHKYNPVALLKHTEAHVKKEEQSLERLTSLLETFPAG